MPNNTSKTSALADESLSAPSVLDFLYHDGRRIGSFLAQFEGDGHLQQFTRTKDASRGKRESSSQEAKGNIGVAGGKLQAGKEIALEMVEGYARVFDPYWANARAFLDYLSQNEMIQRDLTSAELGQFVLVKGYLSVLDLVMFKEAWKMPAFQRKVKEGVSPSKKLGNMTAAEKSKQREEKDNTDLMLEMMQIMPHSIHASLVLSGDQPGLLWCTLKEEYIVTPASDIVLAHGAMMPGEWIMVGILSAKPEYLTPDLTDLGSDQVPGLMQSVVGQVSSMIAPIVRVALGRPAAAYAMTPLLIFREVA